MNNVYSLDELKEVLLDSGYRNVRILENKVIALKIDGTNYLLNPYHDGDIQFVCPFGSRDSFSLDKVNAWNSRTRIGKFYLSEDGDGVLDFCLTPGENEKLKPHQIISGVRLIEHLYKVVTRSELFE